MRRHSGARALAREPGIHNPWSVRISPTCGYGFRARRERARRPGMTETQVCEWRRAYDWFRQIGPTRSLSEYSQIAEPRGIEFSSVFASIPAMESSTLDGGFLGIEFSSESMIANTRTGS